MAMFFDPKPYFGIVVSRGIGIFLAGQRKNDLAYSSRTGGNLYVPFRRRSSMRAHSRHKLIPVAASTISLMNAPPTRAARSRK